MTTVGVTRLIYDLYMIYLLVTVGDEDLPVAAFVLS